jgi:hypothetical protein
MFLILSSINLILLLIDEALAKETVVRGVDFEKLLGLIVSVEDVELDPSTNSGDLVTPPKLSRALPFKSSKLGDVNNFPLSNSSTFFNNLVLSTSDNSVSSILGELDVVVSTFVGILLLEYSVPLFVLPPELSPAPGRKLSIHSIVDVIP